MNSDYFSGKVESKRDIEALASMFSKIFDPEPVGVLAETISNHMPRMGKENWFVAQEKKSSDIVSAFALVPWNWEMDGISLKVAEMAIVGTLENHRGRGLFRMLQKEFDRALEDKFFDLAVVQGIPGFYHRFGFYYAVDLENHIDMPMHLLPKPSSENEYYFRLAIEDDISFLMKEDSNYRKSFFLSVARDTANWEYLLSESLKTEYGSQFWIMEKRDNAEKYYFRVPFRGFGDGLIVSEISETITFDALSGAFAFLRNLAESRGKPYVRFNIHSDSTAGKIAVATGAEKGAPYAWQVKIPDKIRLLRKMAPVLEKRMKNSCFYDFSGQLKLEFFKTSALTTWNEGTLEMVENGAGKECENVFCVNDDLVPPLFLGRRSWRQLQCNRPDIFPAFQYVGTAGDKAAERSGLLMDALFPPEKSWIYEQY